MIDEYAFYKCNTLTSIAIPGSVANIGERAFENCVSLTKITISKGVTSIGNCAFFECTALEGINIPDSITNIGSNAFGTCIALERLTVDENNSKYYSKGNCIIEKSTKALVLGCKNSVIPDDVTSIGDYAFCPLSSGRFGSAGGIRHCLL